MASFDSLPADQRAVLELVLRRGSNYDEIARLLSIDRAAVRQRALSALDALGPQTAVPQERRALITDYLLGQLPQRVGEQTRAHLAASASERAWARVVASELAPLSSGPLPEIPTGAGAAVGEAPAATPTVAAAPATAAATAAAASTAAAPPSQQDEEPQPPLAQAEQPSGQPRSRRPSSRRGGAILLGLAAVAVIAVVVVLLTTGGGGGKHRTRASTGATRSGTTSTGAGGARIVSQINLVPTAAGSKAAGIAEVLRQGSSTGIAIVAQNIPANHKRPPDAYAVWLYNSPTDSRILGFVNPGVSANGRLQTAGALPANAGHYKQLLVTLETQANPRAPGKIVLQGSLTGV